MAESILFDLDGTLIDSEPGVEAALRWTMAQEMPEFPIDQVDFRIMIGPPVRETFWNLLGRSSPLEEVVRLENTFRKYYNSEGWKKSPAFPGVTQTLAALHQRGYRLFVVTNKLKTPSAAIIEMHGWTQYFEALYSLDSRQPPYADKVESVRAVLEDRRIQAGEAWMVGDTPADSEAAHQNGMRFLLAAYGYGTAFASNGLPAHGVLNKPEDLLGWVNGKAH